MPKTAKPPKVSAPVVKLDPVPDAGYCPRCRKMVWAGGAPQPGEFPLTCNGVACDQVIHAPEEAVFDAKG